MQRLLAGICHHYRLMLAYATITDLAKTVNLRSRVFHCHSSF